MINNKCLKEGLILKPSKKQKKLDNLAFSFVLRKRGRWTDKSFSLFSQLARKKNPAVDDADITLALERARDRFNEGKNHIYLCTGPSCKSKRNIKLTKKNKEKYAEKHGLCITNTKCQGPCKKAPVALLRTGDQFKTINSLKKKKDLKELAKDLDNSS